MEKSRFGITGKEEQIRGLHNQIIGLIKDPQNDIKYESFLYALGELFGVWHNMEHSKDILDCSKCVHEELCKYAGNGNEVLFCKHYKER